MIVDFGTRFDVAIAPDGVRVRLIEGSAKVFHGSDDAVVRGEGVVLRPGESLDAGSAGDRIIHASATTAGRLPTLSSDDERLGDMIERLNRYDRVQLQAADQSVASIRIRGSFRTGEAARLAHVLGSLYPVHFHRAANGNYLIESNGAR